MSYSIRFLFPSSNDTAQGKSWSYKISSEAYTNLMGHYFGVSERVCPDVSKTSAFVHKTPVLQFSRHEFFSLQLS